MMWGFHSPCNPETSQGFAVLIIAKKKVRHPVSQRLRLTFWVPLGGVPDLHWVEVPVKDVQKPKRTTTMRIPVVLVHECALGLRHWNHCFVFKLGA
ncbi:unnamed protein product [Cladocopium goreaui]|uniref:Uncharacterized protein n=1 Tax=Cladocopium goreaui TaxID=2562237 RepID=A0A9P1BTY8_9DINO|nr:unnamed protein product [Cladocopium goreaui]